MHALAIAVICSSAVLGSAFADPAQPQTADVPSASPPAVTSAAPAPAQMPGVAAAPASAVAATSGPAAVPEQSASSAVNLDEIVCRNTAPATGTRLGGGRECHTVRQWNERERQAQDITRQQQVVGFAGSK